MSKTVDPNTHKRIAAGRKLEAYAKYILDLRDQTIGFNRSLGRLSWLQGDALLKARARCKRGEWGKFLSAISMTESTAYLLRRIAKDVPWIKSHEMEYTEMLGEIFPSYRKSIEDGVKSEDSPTRRTSKIGKGNGISLNELSSTITRMANTAQKIAATKHEDGTKTPEQVEMVLKQVVYSITRIRRDLGKVEKKIQTRIARNTTLRMAG